MEKLSLKSYAWKCVLGTEVVYFICLIGGLFPLRNIKATELHRTFFEILPGFTWLNPSSVFLGAVYIFVFSWIFAWYYVWMHNSSLVNK